MSQTTPRTTNLFLQLGLDADEAAQRRFLAEEIKEDADWAIVVDQLNESLHEDAVKVGTGLKQAPEQVQYGSSEPWRGNIHPSTLPATLTSNRTRIKTVTPRSKAWRAVLISWRYSKKLAPSNTRSPEDERKIKYKSRSSLPSKRNAPMNSTEMLSKVLELITLEPALEQELKSVTDLDQAIESILAAANRRNIPMDANELTDTLRAAIEKVAAGQLTDEQLAGVTGGINIHEMFRDFIITWVGRTSTQRT